MATVFEVLHTPGHSPGHVSLSTEDGSRRRPCGRHRGVVYAGPPAASPDYLGSLEKMKAVRPRIILPSTAP